MKGKKFFYWLGQADFKLGYPYPSYFDWKYPEWALEAYRDGYREAKNHLLQYVLSKMDRKGFNNEKV